MNIDVFGNGIDVTPAIHDYIIKRLHHVERHGLNHAHRLRIILTVEKLNHTVSCDVHVYAHDLHASATNHDMYQAIDEMVDKLTIQLEKHKA